MFCRLRSGLPEDPSYPEDLKKLGCVVMALLSSHSRYHNSTDQYGSYFVNDKDEIRNIKDPKYYFKFHISKNERYNERQRFAMNSMSSTAPQPLSCLSFPFAIVSFSFVPYVFCTLPLSYSLLFLLWPLSPRFHPSTRFSYLERTN